MMIKIKYKVLKAYRSAFGYFYRGLKKVVRWSSNHQNYTGILMGSLKSAIVMKTDSGIVTPGDVQLYRGRWQQLWPWIPDVFIKIYPPFSGVKSPDYVPNTLYYNIIEPILNNVEYSRSFADKNMYGRLIDADIQPPTLLRKMHGQYLDHDYNHVADVDGALSSKEISGKKFIIKPAIDSRGGKSIALFEGRNGSLYHDEQKIDRHWLDVHYNNNFLIQEFVRQHPFYAALNPSSLNTLRVYTYRSVTDDSIHVLHSMVRVGEAGSLVDNISSGGKAIGLSDDGELSGKANNSAGDVFSRVGEIDLTQHVKAAGFEKIREAALKVAATQYYSRIIGFDFCVDENEKVWLIELNNYDIGIERIQKCIGPLFKEYTDEVITYCQKQKKELRYLIR